MYRPQPMGPMAPMAPMAFPAKGTGKGLPGFQDAENLMKN